MAFKVAFFLVVVSTLAISIHFCISSYVIQVKQTSTSRLMLKNNSNEHSTSAIFSFVPNGIQSCDQLFHSSIPKLNVVSKDFQDGYKQFTSVVKKIQGNLEGFSAKYVEEFIAMYLLAKAPFVRTVCETGFNAGHSTFTWLKANPNTHVYSFDIGRHSYGQRMAKYIHEVFPGRFNITWGNSIKTLPAFRKAHPEILCDLISIDGGHTYNVCKSDFENFKKMSRPKSIIVLDNYPDNRGRGRWMKSLGDVWEGAKRNGEIIEIFQCNYWPKKSQGFSVGLMNV